MKANSWVHSLNSGCGNLIKRIETRCVRVCVFLEQIMVGIGCVWTSTLLCAFVPCLQVSEMLAGTYS